MQQNIEQTLARLIAIPSVPTNADACREIIEYIRSELAPLDLHITTDITVKNPWLIATAKDTKTPKTLLAAHVDVVPGDPDLFTMRRDNGRLYGRGAYDMKFAAACFIEFAKSHTGAIMSQDIGFLFSTDEEIGGASILQILDQGWRPERVFIPDGGEDWRIEARAKGFFGVNLSASGQTAHGSRPWEGDNAIEKILDLIETLRHEFPNKERTDGTLAITGISGGTAVNQIPSEATAMIDFRSFDADELTRFYERLTELASASGIIVTTPQMGAPVSFDRTSPLVQDFLQAYMRVRGTAPEYIDSFGGTDARHFAKFGIPTIITEPRGGGRHASNEWIMAEDLEAYYNLLVAWLA
ncbi:MAG TPA: M20/M25/M40 family metallo-hydrolase [Candidatus Saccharimonadales bacterium]|nr:M20/M25/M40 family metallo-hydrolase [Candidatus Saccharimonadales bacterium]